MKYDILVVGAGLFGAVYARKAKEQGKKVLIIEKNPYVAGMAHTELRNGIMCHIKGPHYFFSNNKTAWDYLNKFANFNQYQAKVNANYQGQIYPLPFNMFLFNRLWGCVTPSEAKKCIKAAQVTFFNGIENLKDWALASVGEEIYEKLIKGYSQKMWARDPSLLPKFIIQRIPVRYTYNNHYHDAQYCGVPLEGYTHLVENIIDGIDIKLNANFFDITNWRGIARQLVYTGPIDLYFNYKYGPLEYRGLRWEHKVVEGDFQGVGQVNYTGLTEPYTRIMEHKHYYHNPDQHKQSVITYEYPDSQGEPCYPVNDEKNNNLYKRYLEDWHKQDDVLGDGRLFNYKYLNMDAIVLKALSLG